MLRVTALRISVCGSFLLFGAIQQADTVGADITFALANVATGVAFAFVNYLFFLVLCHPFNPNRSPVPRPARALNLTPPPPPFPPSLSQRYLYR